MIVGDILARTLGVRMGDDITVELVPEEISAWAPPPPGRHTFRVTGMFHLDFDEYDRRLAYASLSAMQGLLGRGDNVMGVELRVKDADRAGEIAREVEKLLGGPPYEAQDWYTLNQSFFEAHKSER
jgi:lipoprotein-releasing system permease protein